METLKTLNLKELEEELTHLLISKDETLAMINTFGDEDELIERLNEINEKIKQIKKLLN